MSESTTTLYFEKGSINRGNIKKVEIILEEVANKYQCETYEFKRSDGRYSCYFALLRLNDDEIELLLKNLLELGVANVLIKHWFDGYSYLKLIDKKVHWFNSIDELEEYEKELEYQDDQIKLQSLKGERSIIRLKVKAKRKRANLLELFRRFCVFDGQINEFKEAFLSHVSPKDRKIFSWCHLNDKKNDFELRGPEDLILTLIDVVESEDYILLQFDLSKLDIFNSLLKCYFEEDYLATINEMVRNSVNKSSLENLGIILSGLDGVSKVWMKFRLDYIPGCELYYFDPGCGDGPVMLERKFKEDNDWPL